MLEKQIEDEERRENELAKKEILNQLSSSSSRDAAATISQVKKSVLKRSSARRKQLTEIMQSLQSSKAASAKQQNSQLVPFTPFNGDRPSVTQFHVQPQYYDPFIDELKVKKEYIAAGFRAEFVYERVLNEAFMGLGCVISKERQQQQQQRTPELSTV
jgi:CDK-activating kinase assembly factor MAT1